MNKMIKNSVGLRVSSGYWGSHTVDVTLFTYFKTEVATGIKEYVTYLEPI